MNRFTITGYLCTMVTITKLSMYNVYNIEYMYNYKRVLNKYKS